MARIRDYIGRYASSSLPDNFVGNGTWKLQLRIVILSRLPYEVERHFVKIVCLILRINGDGMGAV